MEHLAREKHSSLLDKFKTYEMKKNMILSHFYKIRPRFYTYISLEEPFGLHVLPAEPGSKDGLLVLGLLHLVEKL
jgi:hypothetical protein